MAAALCHMPIGRLLEHIARELEMSSSVFAVAPGFRGTAPGEALPFGRLELPLGVAAGPHTAMAQSLAAAYVAGARSFALATVGPDDLAPEEALEEFIKGRFLIGLLGRELGLGDPGGVVFAMHVSGDREWLTSPRMTAFFDAMQDASATGLWQRCVEEGLAAAGRFNNLDRGAIRALDPCISRLAVLDRADPATAADAGGALLDRGLHLCLKLDPGCDLDAFSPAVAALRSKAEAQGLSFGLSLSAPGPSPAAGLDLAARCARRWPGIPMAYAGGADFFNIQDLVALGLRPVSVCSTLLKPGGFSRLRQLARAVSGAAAPAGVDPAAAEALAQTLARREAPPARRLRLPGRAPMIDCPTAPCQAGCPFGMDITGVLRLMSDGRYRDALRVILDKDPLPHLTGALCHQPCRGFCMRLDYDEAVGVGQAEALCAQRAWEDLLPRLEPEEHRVGQRVAVVGGSPGAMAAAILFARRGVSVTLFAPAERLCEGLCRDRGELREAADRDAELLEVMGADVRLNSDPAEPGVLLRSGYSHVVLALEEDRWPQGDPGQLRLEGVPRLPGDPPPAERVFTLDPGIGPGKIAQAIADAHRAVEAVIGPADPHPHPAGRRGGAMGKKGKLCPPGEAEAECERCLECATVCEQCVDVCPRRANVPITVLTSARPQILHLDALCGGCGACAGACPYEGAPNTDKFTLFETLAGFEGSGSSGFVVLDFLARRVRLRLAGRVWDVCLREGDPAVPGRIEELMETVFTDYPYLLDTGRKAAADQTSLWEE